MDVVEESNSPQVPVVSSEESALALSFLSILYWLRSISISLGVLTVTFGLFYAEQNIFRSDKEASSQDLVLKGPWTSIIQSMSQFIPHQPLQLCFEDRTGAFTELHVHFVGQEKTFASADFRASSAGTNKVCMEFPVKQARIACTARDEAGLHHSWDMEFSLPEHPHGEVTFPIVLEGDYFVLSFRNHTGYQIQRETVDGAKVSYFIPSDDSFYTLGIFPRHEKSEVTLWSKANQPSSYKSLVPTYDDHHDRWEFSTTFEP